MPPFRPNQSIMQRPLQNEIIALNKLLQNDILEHASRVLDHFTTTQSSKLAITTTTPEQLINNLLLKCDDFNTVCDQIYYILEQSKRILQLQYQQNNIIQTRNKLEAERLQQQQQQQQQQLVNQSLDNDDLNLGFNNEMEIDDTPLDVDMVDKNNNGNNNMNNNNNNNSNNNDEKNNEKSNNSNNNTNNNNNNNNNENNDNNNNNNNVDDDELEELLQIQKERLDMIKKVMVLGIDAATINEDGKSSKDDLLF